MSAEPHWKLREPTFASLMLGRIELAQIVRGTGCDWFWTLRFRIADEKRSFAAHTKDAAMQVCEDHARKALS